MFLSVGGDLSDVRCVSVSSWLDKYLDPWPRVCLRERSIARAGYFGIQRNLAESRNYASKSCNEKEPRMGER